MSPRVHCANCGARCNGLRRDREGRLYCGACARRIGGCARAPFVRRGGPRPDPREDSGVRALWRELAEGARRG